MGNDPWSLFCNKKYLKINLEIDYYKKFNMKTVNNLVLYDGYRLPFKSESVTTVLLIEVLEHTIYDEKLINEIARILRDNGLLILTVPFSARRHHIPFDYRRYTKEGLSALIQNCNLRLEMIRERGNDLDVIYNKLFIYVISLIKKMKFSNLLLYLANLIFTFPILLFFKFLTFFSLSHRTGNRIDPLGYFALARKASN